jgi:hypothetical protein
VKLRLAADDGALFQLSVRATPKGSTNTFNTSKGVGGEFTKLVATGDSAHAVSFGSMSKLQVQEKGGFAIDFDNFERH